MRPRRSGRRPSRLASLAPQGDGTKLGVNFMSKDLTLEQIQALVARAPFHQWLGLSVIAVTDDSIEIKAAWREEWVVNKERGYTHGGVPTIDLRVDYHRPAMPGDLTAHGKVIRSGSQFSTAEAQVFDKDGKLVASGRGTYFTAPPKPA